MLTSNAKCDDSNYIEKYNFSVFNVNGMELAILFQNVLKTIEINYVVKLNMQATKKDEQLLSRKLQNKK